MTTSLHPLLPPAGWSDPVLAWAGALLFAALFGSGAWHKWRERDVFRQSLAAYRLLPGSMLAPAVCLLAMAEALVVAGLAASPTRGLAFGLACALLLLYAGAMAVNLLRGRTDIDCGCGGLSQRLSWALVVRNALLAIAALAWTAPVTPRPLAVQDIALFGAAALALFLLHHLADELIRQHTRLRDLRRGLAEEQ